VLFTVFEEFITRYRKCYFEAIKNFEEFYGHKDFASKTFSDYFTGLKYLIHEMY
jgi:hypothetical protein